MKATIGQKVYVKELNEYGIVESLTETGQPKTIKIGTRIIKAIDYIIQNAGTIVVVLKFFRSLFKF
jgi:hypothetical protein